jgi:hypothetical protein
MSHVLSFAARTVSRKGRCLRTVMPQLAVTDFKSQLVELRSPRLYNKEDEARKRIAHKVHQIKIIRLFMSYKILLKNSKAVPVKGRRGPFSCEMSRLTHFLDNRLTDSGDVRLSRRPPFTPHQYSWYSLLLGGRVDPQDHSVAGRIKSIENSNDPIGN